MHVVGLVVQVVPAFWRVHLGRWSGNSHYFADVSKNGQNPRLSSAFMLCLFGLSLKYAFIRILRGFLARFGAFVWVCIACVLCVACGAFVRVYG